MVKTRRYVNAIGAHHDEMEMQYVISPIVQACDSISGARPGARREIMQQYIQRIKDLENLALAYQGVEKAYAIQAGRELGLSWKQIKLLITTAINSALKLRRRSKPK